MSQLDLLLARLGSVILRLYWNHFTGSPSSLEFILRLFCLLKCIYGLAPKYLSDLVTIKTQGRYRLRSCGTLSLLPPHGKHHATLGDRAFMVVAPKLWNSLPANIRAIESITSFKTALKTHLFKLAFRS